MPSSSSLQRGGPEGIGGARHPSQGDFTRRKEEMLLHELEELSHLQPPPVNARMNHRLGRRALNLVAPYAEGSIFRHLFDVALAPNATKHCWNVALQLRSGLHRCLCAVALFSTSTTKGCRGIIRECCISIKHRVLAKSRVHRPVFKGIDAVVGDKIPACQSSHRVVELLRS